MRKISLALVAVVLLSGCAGFGTYMKDRGNDFLDCFGARFSGGLGLLFNVRATQELQLGVGLMYVSEYGFIGRKPYDWRGNLMGEIGLPLLFYMRSYVWGGLIEPKGGDTKGIMYTIPQDEKGPCSIAEFDRDWDRQFFDIGFTVHALVLGVNFEFRTKEFADFLLGWFGVDFAGDDTKAEESPPESEGEAGQ
jgi:hypothetical protein